MSDDITDDERAELVRRRPINWDDMGSSARDLWVDRHLGYMRNAPTGEAR